MNILVYMINKILKLSLPKSWKVKSIQLGLILSLLLVLFLTSVIFVIYLRIKSRIVIETNIEQLEELNIFHYALRNRISRIESHVNNLPKSKELHNYIHNRDEATKKYIEAIFSDIIDYNTEELSPTFNQMRILDLQGNEIIRVDLNNQMKAEVVSNLQDKSHRYYFKDLEKQIDCEIYLSKIDLNIEFGKIEDPLNPVLRVGRSIINSEGKRIGYFIINVKFEDITDEIENLSIHAKDNWYLLDQNGYYLYHPDKSLTYSFMFNTNSNKGFFNDYPNIWKEFNSNRKAVHKNSGDVFYFKSFNFNTETRFNTINTREIHLVMHMPEESLNEKFLLLKRGLVIGFVFMFPILTILGITLGISWTKNRYYIETLESRTIHDSLTKLLNKRGAYEKLTHLVELAERLEKSLALLFIDLNDLKKVNDSFGHDYGDILIISMSNAIFNTLRSTDEAGRIGGDEFIIALLNVTDDDLEILTNRLKENFNNLTKPHFSFIPSFSYGKSYWKGEHDSIDALIKRADDEMYIMKKNKI